jgi:hypothetical protein
VPFCGSDIAPLMQPAVYEPTLWALSPICVACLMSAQSLGDEEHSEKMHNNMINIENFMLELARIKVADEQVFYSFKCVFFKLEDAQIIRSLLSSIGKLFLSKFLFKIR